MMRFAVTGLVLLFAARSAATDWQRLPLATTAIVTTYDGQSYGNVGNVAYNATTQTFWAASGGYCTMSVDGGRSWQLKDLPPSTAYVGLAIGQSDSRALAFWTDLLKVNHAASWSMKDDEWVELALDGDANANGIGIEGHSAIVGIDLITHAFWWSSSPDSGWHRHVTAGTGSNPFNAIISPSPGVLAIQAKNIWYEISAIGLDSTMAGHILSYGYGVSKNSVAASMQRNVSGKKQYCLGFSTDHGANWNLVDTITFVNSARKMGKSTAPNSDFQTVFLRTHGDTTNFIFANGWVVTTLDHGLTFIDRGTLPVASSAVLSLPVTYTSKGDLLFAASGRIIRLPSDANKKVEFVTMDLGIVDFAVGPTSIVCAGVTHTMVSENEQWYLTTPIESIVDVSKYPSTGQKAMLLNRISVEKPGYVAGVGENAKIHVITNPETQRWRVLDYRWHYAPRYTSEHDTKYAVENFPLLTANEDEVTFMDGLYPVASQPGTDTLRILPSSKNLNVVPIRFYLADNTEIFCQYDSLWHSTDNGRTWLPAGLGIPTDSNGRQATVSSVVRLNEQTLLCGLHAAAYISPQNDTTFQLGGMWISNDNGNSWSQFPHDSLNHVNVWYVHRKGDVTGAPLAMVGNNVDTLIAAIGNVYYEDDGASWPIPLTMSNARIVTSTDGGRTWKTTFNEPRKQPAFGGKRKIVTMPNGSFAAATVEAGVVWSNNGMAWQQIGTDVLSQTFISDLDVDSMGTLYASTEKGIYKIDVSAVVSVEDDKLDEPDSKRKYFTLWTYPTPAFDKLTVRINNVETAKGDIRSLKLYDMYGNIVQDATGQMPLLQASGRFEFPVTIANPVVGVYLLVLETGIGTFSTKVMIVPHV